MDSRMQKIKDLVEYIGVHTEHGEQPEPCPICTKVDEILALLTSEPEPCTDDNFGPVNLNDEEPDDLSFLRKPEPCEPNQDAEYLRRFIKDHAFPAAVAYDLIASVDRLSNATKVADKLRESIEKEVRADFARQALDTIPKLTGALDGWIRAGWSTEHMAGDLLKFWLPDRSQVDDKRVEELMAQLDRANTTIEEVAAQRNRAMEDVETLREFVADAVQWSEAHSESTFQPPTPEQVDSACKVLGSRLDRIAAMILRGYTMRWSEKARALLAATKPKMSH